MIASGFAAFLRACKYMSADAAAKPDTTETKATEPAKEATSDR